MNPQLLGAGAAFLAVVIWLVSRRRPLPFASLDASAVAALNRAQISLVRQAVAPAQGALAAFNGSVQLPVGARQRQLFLRTLQAQLSGDTCARLASMQSARAWGHRDTLPLLKRGLRDVSPEVVLEASLAMAVFRGRSTAQAASRPQLRLPRNAALTR